MSLRFILGRAGTGKSHTCLEGIRQALHKEPAGNSIIFLVPEQATFQMERALVNLPGLAGTIRAQVLSFRRMAFRVLQEAGGASRPHIGELGKRMALQALLIKRTDDLKVYNRAARRTGFVEQLARTISEMKSYRLSPGDIKEHYLRLKQTGGEDSLLAAKLHDLACLYADWEEWLKNRYIDPDDYLNLLAEKIPESRLIKGATVWVDGFAGFTPQEYHVLGALLRAARQVNVALCIDSRDVDRELEETDLFYSTWETYHKLRKIAEDNGIPVAEPLILDRPGKAPFRFALSPELAHLEREFFRYPTCPFRGKVEGIQLVAAADRRAEVEAAARKMISLCRDRGYRWREMAVILRDLEPYRDLIETVFGDYGIPYFIDRKQEVSHHPLVELLRSALEIVTTRWADEPVFRFLKTDLVPLERGEVDHLENYVLAHGIKGEIWLREEPWDFNYELAWEENGTETDYEERKLAAVNAAREKVRHVLEPFYRRLNREKLTVKEICKALWDLLAALKVSERLEEWRLEAEKQGDLVGLQEQVQVWNGVLELLDQMAEALGEEEITVSQYAQILEAGLESLRLGLIPPAVDQVLVGNVERSRHPNLRAAFVLGAGEGIMPARMGEEGVFSDKERSQMRKEGLELAPTRTERVLQEQYLIYIALTRSGEYLWLSYPLADAEGKALNPSPVVNRLREIFPALEVDFAPKEPAGEEDLEFVVNPNRSLTYLINQLREVRQGKPLSAVWAEVYQWFVEDEKRKEDFRKLVKALNYSNLLKPLPRELVQKLYGKPLRSSVSRLETFAACPFSYFASYGLQLKERRVFGFEAPDRGVFFHRALKRFVEKLQQRSRKWGELDGEERRNLVLEVVEELRPWLQRANLLGSARHDYIVLKLRRELELAVEILTEHARRGSFVPVAVEMDFGGEGSLPPLRLPLPEGEMELRGRIDRVDWAEWEGRHFFRVIDYKSSPADLRLEEVYHGLSLQLLCYLAVVLENAEKLAGSPAEPGGVLYFSVYSPLVNESGPVAEEVRKQEIKKRLKMKGLVLADMDAVRLMGAREKGETSYLIPVRINRDGSLGKASSAASREQFEMLLRLVKERAQKLGSRIVRGEIVVAPYRRGQESPCRHCRYRPVCQFDPLAGDQYRFLEKIAGDFWERVAAELEGGEANGL
ncbi:helicase-exonuclease AddAB subunit AddB [Calderihabitans maritimus]|uniref:ATP-dependent helicase/deoxyribonuclease subunit B n=1 Tax=Calderihabitans maritimus TaxID=1246530 RepID=A0A1Z5HNQ7_9FIRM|nr:helicase-exonuclease AddAB subunit AddB [Calderihabitans maritimus]GAW91169.1 ATP-dependent helicase/deoxyribonuclease subunit B [Calderihabitans maritimus]